MLAAKGLSAVLDDFHGAAVLQAQDIWFLLGAMVLAVLGRYIFSYLRAKTQESVGYEATADERIRLGDIMKRVSLGFFNKIIWESYPLPLQQICLYGMYAMNMVNTVVNGYITVIVLILFLAFTAACGFCRTGWSFALCTLSALAGKAKPEKRPCSSESTGRYGGKFYRVSARDAGGESL